MTVKTAFSTSFSSEGTSRNFSYAVLIPGSSIVQSGGFARLKFVGSTQLLSMRDAYLGGKGSGGGDFTATPVQILVGGASSWAVPTNGVVYSDPFAIGVVSGEPLVLRFDIPDSAGQAYSYTTGLTGAALHYKAGNRGVGNADLLLGSGYSSLSGWVSSLAEIKVADALEDFADVRPPSPSPSSVGVLAELEARCLANQMGAAAQAFAGDSGKRTAFSYQIAIEKGVYGFLDMVTITPDADCDVVIVAAVAPPEAVIFNVHCNTNYAGPPTMSKCRHWKTTSLPDDIGGRHTAYRLKGGVPRDLFIPRSFLGVIPPGGGVSLILDTPGVGAHIAFDWHEKALA